MKKLALLGIILAFCFSLAGCSENNSTNNSSNTNAENATNEEPSNEQTDSTQLVLVDTGLHIEHNSFSYALVIENPYDGLIADRPAIKMTILDANGETILSTTDHLPYVGPGEKIVYCGAKSTADLIDTVEFELVAKESSWISESEAPDRVKNYEITSLEKETAEDGSLSFSGQVKNPGDTQATLRISIALFDASGKAITGVFDFADQVPPGETGSFKVAVPTSIPTHTTYEAHATFSY